MRSILFTVIGCLLAITLPAQTLIGRITSTKGEAIPNATIYFHETTRGIMANEYGEFQANIKMGDYTCEISSLGYEKKKMIISIPEEGLSLTIELTEKALNLNEVVVTPGKEDPAYRIMRNVIAHAPYHLHQVKKYESEVYLKGNFKVEKVPALIKSQIKEKEIKDMIGKLFVYESQSKVKYSEPDKYEQHITAISSTIPKSFNFGDNMPLSVVMNNIYHPSSFGGLLAPGSFSAYKFKLEDSYNENGILVNKIRVIPRKKSGMLVDGWLYITDRTWSVQQAKLSLSQAGMTYNYNLIFNEIKPGAFLPTAYDMTMKVDVMGIKGGGLFYVSIKYDQLETNDDHILTQPHAETAANQQTIQTKKTPTKKQQKNIDELEKLASKDKLTTREAYKMADLMQKTVESDEVKKQNQKLEIRPLDSIIIVTRDSLALKRDSLFWNLTRTVPLHQEELVSYIKRDSIMIVADSLKSVDSLQNRTFGRWAKGSLFGETFMLGKKFYIQNNGLLLACTEYNFVDGFRIGQRIETGVYLSENKNRLLSIAPAVYYTTARKEIDYKIDGTLIYAPMRNGHLSISTGNTIADHAARNGTGRFGNTLGSILFAGNTAKFYQKKYASISNRVDVANGLTLITGFNYENRSDLENNLSFNFLNKRPNSNRPHGQTDIMPEHKAYIASITLEYTPRLYYSVWNGRKHYRKTDYPTTRLSYKKGFGGSPSALSTQKKGQNSSFDNIEATVLQNVKLGLFSSLYYEVNAGTFLSSRQTYLADFKHFRTNEMFLSGKTFDNSFLMDNYRYATNDKWIQTHITYSSNYLLLKQLPLLQGMIFDEAIHMHTMWTPDINYNEAGYSLGFGRMLRVGVFVGFDKFKHKRTGVLISLPIMDTMNK